ncbi:MAG TPA: patatin-like phospholipase family protein [Acidimicrobiales bacterium]|nr:patatin-like phospholipase family protein [Acidimicrobiales bacterium]
MPLFRDLPDDALGRIATRARLTRWPEGAIVFRQGDAGDAAYIVRSGAVEVLTGADAAETVASLGADSVVGELALLTGESRSATLRTTAPTELVAIDRADFEAMLAEQPSIGLELSRQLSRRLVDTTRLLRAEVPTRVAGVWGNGARDLATALLEEGTVGVLTLPGARAPELPPGAVALTHDSALPDWGSRRVDGLDVALIVLPDVPSPLGLAARNLTRYVFTFGGPPSWLAQAGRRPLHVRCEEGPAGVERAVRWLTGRAVGLALSSGGSKAVAHVGVIEVLQEHAVPIDAVAGSSGGALAAVAVAFGVRPEEMMARVRELARQTRLHRFDFHVLPRAGFFKGVRLRHLFETWFPGAELSGAQLPIWLLATNVHTGSEVVLDRGPVSDALRASMSIPGAFDPWLVAQEPLIDGAVVNPLPASVLRDAGVGTVVASNVAGQELTIPTRRRSPHLVQTMARMINSMERELIKTQAPLVDVMVRPVLKAQNSFDFSDVDGFVAEGARASSRRRRRRAWRRAPSRTSAHP